MLYSVIYLFALISSADAAARCMAVRMMGSPFDGVGRATPTRGFGARAAAGAGGRAATAVEDRDDKESGGVVSESTIFGTVSDLNELSLSKFRCHSLANDPPPNIDPFALVTDEIAQLNEDVCDQVAATDEVLTASAQHFFGAGNTRAGKRVRPVLVCLMGQATALAAKLDEGQQQHAEAQYRRLAAITEMIHTASLVHDDVLDAADTRRGGSAVHKLYSTKAAVLSGDFLLVRALSAPLGFRQPCVLHCPNHTRLPYLLSLSNTLLSASLSCHTAGARVCGPRAVRHAVCHAGDGQIS